MNNPTPEAVGERLRAAISYALPLVSSDIDDAMKVRRVNRDVIEELEEYERTLKAAIEPPTPGAVGELVEALQRIAAGDEPRPVGAYWNTDHTPSKHDRCIHERWMYEDCGQCVAEFVRAALERPHSKEQG